MTHALTCDHCRAPISADPIVGSPGAVIGYCESCGTMTVVHGFELRRANGVPKSAQLPPEPADCAAVPQQTVVLFPA